MRECMKKIISIILLFSLTGCMKENQSIVCSTISQDDSTHIAIEYEYANNKEITNIKKTIRVSFQQDVLKETSLKEKYHDIQKEYKQYDDVEGLQYAISMEEQKNTITAVIEVDLSIYDFKKDYFELGEEHLYEDITKVIEDISELGYYHCNEN